MGNYRFLLFYFLVFILSYQGLISGGTGDMIVDIILTNIFFIFCYINIFSLKVYSFKENKIMIPIIILTSALYFYRIDFVLLLIYLCFISYPILIKKYNFNYDDLKSVFFNFIKNASVIDLIIILLFVIISLKFYL